MQKLYNNGSYLSNNPTWHVERSAWKAEKILRMIRGNNINPGTICEVGCGAGEILRLLQKKMPADCVFIGYDVSSQAIKLCEKRGNNRLSFKNADFTLVHNETYDLMLLIDVVEHVEDYFHLLRHVRSKSRYTLLRVPLDMSVQKVLRAHPLMHERKKVGHIHYFTKELILQTLKDVGYEIIDYFYSSCTVSSSPRSKKIAFGRHLQRLFFKLNQDVVVRILGGYSLMILAKSEKEYGVALKKNKF